MFFGEQFLSGVLYVYCKIRTAQRTNQNSPFCHGTITSNYTMHYKNGKRMFFSGLFLRLFLLLFLLILGAF